MVRLGVLAFAPVAASVPQSGLAHATDGAGAHVRLAAPEGTHDGGSADEECERMGAHDQHCVVPHVHAGRRTPPPTAAAAPMDGAALSLAPAASPVLVGRILSPDLPLPRAAL